MDSCAKKYHCAYAIYLLTCITLLFYIIIDRAVVAPGYGKYVVDGLNYRDKRVLKLEMLNLLNSNFICATQFFKFMQVHENEEYQSVSLAKEANFFIIALY